MISLKIAKREMKRIVERFGVGGTLDLLKTEVIALGKAFGREDLEVAYYEVAVDLNQTIERRPTLVKLSDGDTVNRKATNES